MGRGNGDGDVREIGELWGVGRISELFALDGVIWLFEIRVHGV